MPTLTEIKEAMPKTFEIAPTLTKTIIEAALSTTPKVGAESVASVTSAKDVENLIKELGADTLPNIMSKAGGEFALACKYNMTRATLRSIVTEFQTLKSQQA